MEIVKIDIWSQGAYVIFKHNGNYYKADKARVVNFPVPETMIFPSDKEGNITDWKELYEDRSGKDLYECIKEFINTKTSSNDK